MTLLGHVTARASATGSRRLAHRVVAGVLLAAAQLTATAEEPPSPSQVEIQADGLVAQAAHERQAGHLDRARSLCEQALLIQPGNAGAAHELALVESMQTGTPRADAEDNASLAQLKRQEALADARLATDQAELLVAVGRTADAAAQLEVAIAALSDEHLHLGPEGERELERLQQTLTRLHQQMQEEQDARTASARAGSLHQAAATTQAQVADEHAEFRERVHRVQELRRKRHLELALNEARLLMHDFPAEAEADRLFHKILAEVHEQRRLTLEERRRELLEETQENINLSLLPDGIDGMPMYPADYAHRHTEQTGLAAPATTPTWKLRLLDALETRVNVDAEAENGTDVILALGRGTGINIVIDPQVVAGGEKPVTLRAANISFKSVLNWVTLQMGTTWRIRNGAVYIGGTDVAESVLKVYDVASLVFQPEDKGGKELAFNLGGGGGNGSGAPQLFKKVEDTKPSKTPEDIVDLLKKVVSPEIWSDEKNAITISGSTLYITAPLQVHELITQFLRSQEHGNSLQVQVDTRWVELDDNYIEEIGVDWGNVNLQSLLPAYVNPFAPNLDPTGFYKETGSYGTSFNDTNTMPASKVQAQIPVQQPGLNVSVARLGQSQLSAVFQATETASRGHYVTSPSIVTLNGVQASCFFGQEIAYIQSYDVVASTLDPQIAVLDVGSSLIIKPFVSSDGKYVSMSFRPVYATATFFEETLFAPRIITTSNATFYGGEVPYPIELPNVQVDEAATSVMIPDGSSLLLGGFGSHIDQTTGARIPFLGDIPFLGRLFGRRGRYSQRSKLYLLAHVSVINYDELEATQ